MPVEPERVRRLNSKAAGAGGRYVLYWMQAAQRSSQNPALEFAIEKADELRKPLIVFFGLTPDFPEANRRHYSFMLEGLSSLSASLAERGIKFVCRLASPEKGAMKMSGDAALAVSDRGYLRIQRSWREDFAKYAGCPVFQVETEAVVPVETVSEKEEYSAATLRRKITPALGKFLRLIPERKPKRSSLGMDFESLDLSDAGGVMDSAGIRGGPAPSPVFKGGEQEASRRLEEFIRVRLDSYAEHGNDPSKELSSGLSPYLHFGQISPVKAAVEVLETGSASAGAFVEELVVRRELAFNFALHNPSYDSYGCVPRWAAESLSRHASDRRNYLYSFDELEAAATHDPYWNAAQREMLRTGKMHNYMRMYWGKKIIEWSRTPQEAFGTALLLNNKYELDGRDPNGFAGVAWCFGKHDRPWTERPIFGSVRYMNDKGLERKFDIGRYAAKFGGQAD